jgi:mitochondrial distribution and morphology protein 12
MSLDFNWALLADGVEASKLKATLNEYLRQVDRPPFVGELEVTSLDFGTIPPHVEILDITDPMDEFYLPDGAWLPAYEPTASSSGAGRSSTGPASAGTLLDASRAAVEPLQTSRADPSPAGTGVSATAPLDRSLPSSSTLAAAAAAPATTTPRGGSSRLSTSYGPPSSWASPPPLSALYSTQHIASLKRSTDVQVDVLVEYAGNLTLGISTELIINQPTPNFMSMPITLTLKGFRFRGRAILAYLGDRVNFCFQEPDPIPGSHVPASILSEVFIESVIGDAGKQVHRSIEIEKFIVDMFRKGIDEYLVFPNYHSVDLMRPYDAAVATGPSSPPLQSPITPGYPGMPGAAYTASVPSVPGVGVAATSLPGPSPVRFRGHGQHPR